VGSTITATNLITRDSRNMLASSHEGAGGPSAP
jgi:hypothetical protein